MFLINKNAINSDKNQYMNINIANISLLELTGHWPTIRSRICINKHCLKERKSLDQCVQCSIDHIQPQKHRRYTKSYECELRDSAYKG